MPRDSNEAMTCVPSVTIDGDAHVPHSWWLASCGVSSRTTRSQTTRPSLRSSAMTTYLWVPGALPRAAWASASVTPTGTAVETKTRSPQMTGVPAPRPGISFFQRMFLVSLHSSRRLRQVETPVPSGPRHCGQYCSPSAADSER